MGAGCGLSVRGTDCSKEVSAACRPTHVGSEGRSKAKQGPAFEHQRHGRETLAGTVSWVPGWEAWCSAVFGTN